MYDVLQFVSFFPDGGRQILWLFGDEHYVTEVGAMNIFFLVASEDGDGVELITSPLEKGDILDGEGKV